MADKELDKVIKAMTAFTETQVINLSLDIHGELIEETPVDTGWAQNNWQLGVASSPQGTLGSPENVDTSGPNAGVPNILSWKISKGPIYITNNVPYILPLNAGHSKKAPKGFIEKTVKEEIKKAETISRGFKK
jgi:hypothetical protein